MHNALMINVEDYFQVAALSETIRPEDWSRHEFRVESNTHVSAHPRLS